MPVIGWNTTIIDGKKWLVIDLAKLRVPLEWDPSSGVFLAVSAPDGGILNHPALAKGDDGETPLIDENIEFTPLAYEDPTADFASFVQTAPGLYQLHLGLHVGKPGDPGSSVMKPSDYGTPAVGWFPRVKALPNGQFAFELAPPRIGGRYGPTAIANVPSGQAAYTLCPIAVPGQLFDWFPRMEVQSILTGTGANVRSDLVCRLYTDNAVNAETNGPIVGRGFGPVGTNPQSIATSVCAARLPDSQSYVPRGSGATVFVRVERQSGTDYTTILAETTIAELVVEPLP